VSRVISVNVGTPRQLSVRRGRPTMSAIVKEPVEGPVRVEGINLAGDRQADLRVHGGPDKAVYAYAREDSDWWAAELGREIPDGMFGENLTLAGVEVTNAVIGERWRIGSTVLEVCQPRLPCSKLGLRFGDLKMVKRFGQASRPGAYLRIVTEGELRKGDEIVVLSRPEHGITVANVADAILVDDSLMAHVSTAPELAQGLAEQLRAQAA
jgi:MOSC domain-containing protein YiiM